MNESEKEKSIQGQSMLLDEDLDQVVGGIDGFTIFDLCRKTYVVGVCHGPAALGTMCPHLKKVKEEKLRLTMVRLSFRCDKGYFENAIFDLGF